MLLLIKTSWQLVLEDSRVAQWKRAGPITQRSVDRNHALLKFYSSNVTNKRQDGRTSLIPFKLKKKYPGCVINTKESDTNADITKISFIKSQGFVATEQMWGPKNRTLAICIKEQFSKVK